MRAQCSHRRTLPVLPALLATISILFAAPAFSKEFAELPWKNIGYQEITWEDWRAQVVEMTAKAVDVVLVRPLAAARVVVGALMFIPAALFSLPMGQEGFGEAYDTLIDEPVEYAFRRKIGEM